MKVEDIDLLLGKIRDSSGVDEFVVIGSLSALGLSGDGLPPRMTWSMEVDAYPERDPQRLGCRGQVMVPSTAGSGTMTFQCA